MNAPRYFAGSCLAVLLLFTGMVPAQQPALSTNAPAPKGNRYLIVLDTSRSMNSRLEATLSLVDHLITSGMDGRLRRGDTIGLWQFASKLEFGAFPLQVWIPERSQQISTAMVSYLQNARFAGSTDLREPLKAALELVKESDSLTVLFLTDGDVPFKGTPFDADINTAIRRSARPMRIAGLPFAVFLVGRGGKLTTYAVNSASKPLAYPPLEDSKPKTQAAPAEALKTETPEPKPPPVEVKPEAELQPAEVAVAPPAQTEVKTATPAQSEPTNAAPVQPAFIVPAAGPQQTNEKGSVILPQPVATAPVEPTPPTTSAETKLELVKPAEPAPTARPAETPIAPETPVLTETKPDTNQQSASPAVTNSSPVSQPVIAVPTETPAQPPTNTPATTPIESVAQPPTNTPALTPVEIVAQPAAAPVVRVASPAESESRPPKPEQPAVASKPVEPATSTADSGNANSAPSALKSSVTEPPGAVANQDAGSVTTARTAPPEPKPLEASNSPPTVSATVASNTPALALVAIPVEGGYSSRSLLIAAFTLLGIAVGMSLLLLRRRSPAGASIITRSLDHEKH